MTVPTIDEIRNSDEYREYESATIAYAHAWRSSDPKRINAQTDWLYLRYDQLRLRCQNYVHLVDTCRREILQRARTATA